MNDARQFSMSTAWALRMRGASDGLQRFAARHRQAFGEDGVSARRHGLATGRVA